MKSLFASLIGVIIFILIVGLIINTAKGEKTILTPYLHPSQATSSPTPTGLSNLEEIIINKIVIMASIADTQDKRSRGLSGISSLPSDQGMLFVFESRGITPSFWMKNMLIPIDIIWVANNKVVEITPSVPNPAPNTADKNLKIYTPGEPIDFVLEVNAGFAAKNNIKVGDSFTQ